MKKVYGYLILIIFLCILCYIAGQQVFTLLNPGEKIKEESHEIVRYSGRIDIGEELSNESDQEDYYVDKN